MFSQPEFADSLIQSMSRAFICVDPEHRILNANKAALADFSNRSLDAVKGKCLNEVLRRKQLAEQLEQGIAAARETRTHENDIVSCIEGELLRLQSICCEVRDADGTVKGYTLAYQISNCQTDQSLDQIIFNNLLQYSEDTLYFKDLNSRFVRCSESLPKKMGAESTAEMMGRTDFDYWDAECAQKFHDDEQKVMRTGKPLIGEIDRELRSDGKESYVMSSKFPLRDNEGNIFGLFGISKDITEHQATQKALEESNKNLVIASRQAGMAEVATNVLHNVGNVLNSFNIAISQAHRYGKSLNCERLMEVADMLTANADQPNYLSDHEQGREIPGYMSAACAQMLSDRDDLIQELNAANQHLEHIKVIVSMQQKYAMAAGVIEQVSISDVVDSAVRMCISSLDRHGIKIRINQIKDAVVSVDQHCVIQILVNLIRNAKHACQDLGHGKGLINVTIDASYKDHFEIHVVDNGIGISPEQMQKLFQHGFTTRKTGHGFGLHSGANSAREAGGSLTAESDGVMLGACFTLSMPTVARQKDRTNSEPLMQNQLDELLEMSSLTPER